MLALLPLAAFAKGTVNDLETDMGARMSVSVNKKITKGFHVVAEGEVRLLDNFSTVGRYHADLGVTYKIGPIFKVGGGYNTSLKI